MTHVNQALFERFGQVVDEVQGRPLVELREVIDTHDWVRLIEMRSSADFECLIAEFILTIPSRPVYDIRNRECVAILLYRDSHLPSIYVLRDDFPKEMPHLNYTDDFGLENPCLSELPQSEQRLQWAPGRYLEQIRQWFEDSSMNRLHRDDQPLEPLFFSALLTIIIKAKHIASSESVLYIDMSKEGTARVSDSDDEGTRDRVVVIKFPTRVHGRVWRRPATLSELARRLSIEDDELGQLISKSIITSFHMKPFNLNKPPILLFHVGLSRYEGHDAEGEFLFAVRLQNVLWANLIKCDEYPDLLISSYNEVTLKHIGVVRELITEELRACNGLHTPPRNVVVLGAGALGSMTTLNLVRQGYIKDILIWDKDVLMPHNLARHTGLSIFLTSPKSAYLSEMVKLIVAPPTSSKFMVGDILYVTSFEALLGGDSESENVDVILDLAASRPVTRHIAYLQANSTSTVPVFVGYLNPSGEVLTMLMQSRVEPADLVTMEMESMLLACDEQVLNHTYTQRVGSRRYGNSCTDISSTLMQSRLAMFSGILSEAIEDHTNASISKVISWVRQDGGVVARVERECVPWHRAVLGETNAVTVHVHPRVVDEITGERTNHLPSETGGYLIGHWDPSKRALYVARAIAAPEDSEGTRDGFSRGSIGVQKTIEGYEKLSAGVLTYVGEWHSHPRNHATHPSTQDKKQVRQLRIRLLGMAQPGFMLIVGDKDIRCVTADRHGISDKILINIT